jgi:hypothetical protein
MSKPKVIKFKMPNHVPKKTPIELKMLPQSTVGMANAQIGDWFYPKRETRRKRIKI